MATFCGNGYNGNSLRASTLVVSMNQIENFEILNDIQEQTFQTKTYKLINCALLQILLELHTSIFKNISKCCIPCFFFGLRYLSFLIYSFCIFLIQIDKPRFNLSYFELGVYKMYKKCGGLCHIDHGIRNFI